MTIHKFKYFSNPEINAEFTEEKCQVCGDGKNCLEGEYFDKGDEVSSVCLNCLIKGEVTVEISSYLRKKLFSHLSEIYTQKDNSEIDELSGAIVGDLEKNPPVPWIQYNDWPVCDGDFMQYLGEWKREDFNNFSPNGNGKEYLLSILDKSTRKKIDDIDVFWGDIGNYTAVFVFRSINSDKTVGVAQSY